ncbi:Usherin [Sesbania bispinosa]|nr:Usherin [Sesbania bispinosa]
MQTLENSSGTGYVDGLNLDKPTDHFKARSLGNSVNGTTVTSGIDEVVSSTTINHPGGAPHPKNSL